MALHSFKLPPGPHLYCGPSAIAAVTGADPLDVLVAAHRVMGRPFKRPIVGMHDSELICTLAVLGFRTTKWEPCERITWRRYARFNRHIGKPQIARSTDHVIAFCGEEMLDNSCHGKPIHFDLYSKPRTIIKYYWTVEPL